MVHLKCTPPWSGIGSLVMRMLERQLTEVVNDNEIMLDIPFVLTINMISVFKFVVIWGIWLALFADALLFDHMLKSGYEDGVDTIQDLIDRDMSLGRI